jgi:hypothetical protein
MIFWKDVLQGGSIILKRVSRLSIKKKLVETVLNIVPDLGQEMNEV